MGLCRRWCERDWPFAGEPFLFRGDRPTASGALGSASRADWLPRGKPLPALRRGNYAVWEPPQGAWRADSGANGGAAAPRGIVLSFEAKESTKESQRHGDYGKKPFIAHFDGGARNVARNGVGQLSQALGARSCSPFSAVKMGGPFSLRCLSPLVFPAVGAWHAQPMRIGMFRRGLGVSWH